MAVLILLEAQGSKCAFSAYKVTTGNCGAATKLPMTTILCLGARGVTWRKAKAAERGLLSHNDALTNQSGSIWTWWLPHASVGRLRARMDDGFDCLGL